MSTPFSEFLLRNQKFIVDVDQVGKLDPAQIVGLKATEEPAETWKKLRQELTNLTYLRIASEAVSLPPSFWTGITNFPALKYLVLSARSAHEIPAQISLLANTTNLEFLSIVAPLATNIGRSIYSLDTLIELNLKCGRLDLSDGISKLRKLQVLEIYGGPTKLIFRLPADLAESGIRQMRVFNVRNVDRLLPVLPPNLEELTLSKCDLKVVPKAWLKHDKLRFLDLNNNAIAQLPEDLSELPSLTLLTLDLNEIKSVPPIKLAQGNKAKITLYANPIRDISKENDLLIRAGQIEK